MEKAPPGTMRELIDELRAGLVCDRCGRYVGSLSQVQYLPAPYAVALDQIGADDEVAAIAGYEWHMLGLLRAGKFTIRHPQRDGSCISAREWARGDGEGEDGGGEDESG